MYMYADDSRTFEVPAATLERVADLLALVCADESVKADSDWSPEDWQAANEFFVAIEATR